MPISHQLKIINQKKSCFLVSQMSLYKIQLYLKIIKSFRTDIETIKKQHYYQITKQQKSKIIKE